MSLTRYLITMGIATIVSAVSWVFVVAFIDPRNSGAFGLTLFFMSFFLGIFGMSSILGFLLRRLFQRRETSFRLVAISFRQATLLAVLVTGSLMLQAGRIFTFWTAFLLLFLLLLIEAFFVARASSREVQRGGLHGA